VSGPSVALLRQDQDDNSLEMAIGTEVRALRRQMSMTLQDLGRLTGLSSAMLSKLENGQASPSLATLKSVARAFEVPINTFFRTVEERRDASYVPAGEGVQMSRRVGDGGHDYWLIGHSANERVALEPYLVRLTAHESAYARKQETGVWFVHVLEGALVYGFGDRHYHLAAGDSLTYDAESPHGIEHVVELPVSFLCVHADRRESQSV
jgi:transcriptional regulator with XRE-family HTH domain